VMSSSLRPVLVFSDHAARGADLNCMIHFGS
jgi:hypothetical protein